MGVVGQVVGLETNGNRRAAKEDHIVETVI